jgi:DNA polymerase-3 subunit epsilon
MLDWIKNIAKESPEFWKNYAKKFKEKSTRYVVVSTETTGLNVEKDVILSIGAIGIENNAIFIGDSFEMSIPQHQFLKANGLENEFLIIENSPKLPENEAIQKFVEFIGNATLVGHRIAFDVEMINKTLEKLGCGRLKNEALDIEVMYKKLHDINDRNFSIDDLCTYFKLSITDRFSIIDVTYTIALLFLKLKSRLKL